MLPLRPTASRDRKAGSSHDCNWCVCAFCVLPSEGQACHTGYVRCQTLYHPVNFNSTNSMHTKLSSEEGGSTKAEKSIAMAVGRQEKKGF